MAILTITRKQLSLVWLQVREASKIEGTSLQSSLPIEKSQSPNNSVSCKIL